MKRGRKYLLLILASSLSIGKPGWWLKENGNQVELVTPQGSWPIVGNMAGPGTDNYYIEIPLRDILPTPTPIPTPTPPPPAPPMAVPSPSPSADNDEDWTDDAEEASKREPAAMVPPKVIVEYDDSDRYVVEANRLYNRGKFYEATNVVEELLRKKPEHLRAWVMKGSLLYMQGQKDLARNAWEQAQKLDPKNNELKKLIEQYQ